MSNYSTLKTAISAVIKENNNHEITGQVLQTTLLAMVDSLADGYLFKGVATPATVVGTPDENVFYIGGAGTYSNFGATPVNVPDCCIGIFTYNGSFENHIFPTGGVFDISAYNAVGGTPATYADLTAALGTGGANIPDYLRKGGMSVKFIQGSVSSSDNNYVQFRLMIPTFSTIVGNWQGVDDEPIFNSKNLIYSGAVEKSQHDILDSGIYAKGDELTAVSTEQAYLQPNGNTTSNDLAITKKFNITGNKCVYITGRQGAYTDSYALACAYDSSNNLLKPYILDPSTNYINYLLCLPVETSYIKVCTSNKDIQASVLCYNAANNVDYGFLMGYKNAVALQNNTDLNNLHTYGIYSFTSAVSQNLSNIPQVGGGYLIVERTTPSENTGFLAIVKQTLIYGLAKTYIRYYGGNPNAWTEWVSYEKDRVFFEDAVGLIPISVVAKYIATDGSLNNNYANPITKLYRIPASAELLYISGRQGSGDYALAAFYNSSMQFISAVVAENVANYSRYEVSVPNNALFIRVCTGNSNVSGDNVYCETKNSSLLTKTPFTQVVANTDLNDYITPGIYGIMSDVSESLQHIPQTGGGYMIVEYTTPSGTVGYKQTITFGLGYTYTRNHINNIIGWTNWVCVEKINEEVQYSLKPIPSYWQSYLDTKVATINSKNYTIAGNGDNFVFITDIHKEYNNGNSAKIIKYIIENTSVRNVVIGGDLCNGDSKAKTLEGLQAIKNDYNFTERVFAIRGNHDIDNSVTEGEYYSIFDRPLENILSTLEAGNSYYYRDNIPQKIRYIFCDCPNYQAAMPSIQIDWLGARITELSSEWTVVIFAHAYWNATTIGSTEQVTAYGNSLRVAIADIIPSANATVAALIVGHCHADKSVQTSSGYWIISTTCDAGGVMSSNYDADTPQRTAGTTSEQVFDVYNIDTANKKIYITRVGGNGSDREFTYGV